MSEQDGEETPEASPEATPEARSDALAVTAAPTPSLTQPLTADPAASGDLLPGTIGRYQVRSVVATGGMGIVLAAHDPELGRQVAIKILAREHDEARTRLVREAQAMARLQHSNVVTVYEVLKVGGRTAIVMELIEGRDLAAWLAEKPRGWREIVAAFVQAARGLAAAHKAGLVHRDFKPSNALIDGDNVVRVTDFGLVRAGAGELEPAEPGGGSAEPAAGELTRTGVVLGTPAYMAPEQHVGGPVDARTDQWAFGCALYGALYGQRPFAGETYGELAAAVTAGELRPEPKATAAAIPRSIRAGIRRALSHDPADRFATMDELIAALTPPRRVWLAAAIAGGVAAAAAITAVVLTSDAGITCEGLDAPFAATWNPDRARALRDQFVASGVGYGADAAGRIATQLDRYRDGWAAMRTRACTDARRGVGSPDLLDRRMHCLDLRLVEVDTVVDTLVTADADLVRTASGVVARLSDVADCADPIDTMPRPTDPAARAAIARAEADAASAFALGEIGRFDQARTLAEGAVKVAEETGWTPLAAKALLELAKWQSRARDSTAALASLDRAAEAAARAGNDVLFADALIQRFYVLADQLDRVDDAFAGKPYIELAVLRAGGAPRTRATWLVMLAVGLSDQKRFQEALDTQLEATALLRQVVEPDNIAISDCLNNEAAYRISLGQLDEAAAILERLLETDAAKFGPDHPELARRHFNLGNIELQRGDHEAGIAHLERTYAIRKAAGVIDWIAPYSLAANVYELGRWSQSLPLFEEALAILERTQGTSEYVSGSQNAIGVLLTDLGDLDKAREWLAKSLDTARFANSPNLDLYTATFALHALAAGDLAAAKKYVAESRAISLGRAAPESGTAELAEAKIALAEHDCARARKAFQRLEARAESGDTLDESMVTDIILGTAECRLAGKRATEVPASRDALEERLAWAEARKPDAGAVAPLRFALARALVATGGDLGRARGLAEAARDGFATLGPPGAKRADEISRWLAAQ